MQRRKFIKVAAVCGGAAAVPTALWLSSRWGTAEAATDARPIVFNQLGYLPSATKMATLRSPSATFLVRALSHGAVVLRGKPGAARDDTASGDRVQIADISAVRQPGMYIFETAAGNSLPFEIGNDVYRHALWLTMRGYYGQRCGCDVDLGDGYSHPA
ncbi:MAG TPA: cellulase N-terminal Ig-like domain-containing protein, partial [Candidatus Sulfotelmatobacter sp.]